MKAKWMQQWDTGTQPSVPCVEPQHNSMIWCHCVTFWVSHTRPDEEGPVRGWLRPLLLKEGLGPGWCCSARDRHPPGSSPLRMVGHSHPSPFSPRSLPGSPRFGIHHSPYDALPRVPLLLCHRLHSLDPGFLLVCQDWKAVLSQSCAPGEGHSTRASTHGQHSTPNSQQYSGYSDKPRKKRDTAHPKGRMLLLCPCMWHLCSPVTSINYILTLYRSVSECGSEVGTACRREESWGCASLRHPAGRGTSTAPVCTAPAGGKERLYLAQAPPPTPSATAPGKGQAPLLPWLSPP